MLFCFRQNVHRLIVCSLIYPLRKMTQNDPKLTFYLNSRKMETDEIIKSDSGEAEADIKQEQGGSDSPGPGNGKQLDSKLDNIKDAPVVQLKTTQDKKQIASIMKLLKNYGLEGSLTELERETGLSKDEIKDLTIETDVIQVLNQYKSNADKDSYKEAYQGTHHQHVPIGTFITF